MPVLNEADALRVLLPEMGGLAECVVVVDNGSIDDSAEVAERFGAKVVSEPRRGYGSACQSGIDSLAGARDDELILFMDGDASDDVTDISRILAPLESCSADLVIGSRTLGQRQRGALAAHARFGNWLATRLIEQSTGVRFSDLGPLRALRLGTLRSLQMRDRGFGWTVEMQLKAALRGLRVVEIPVSYRRRIGRSKISGSLFGSARAGYSILRTIATHAR